MSHSADSDRSHIPRLLVAGVSSGVGKTTVVTGLARALVRRGLSVATFKCGPDYLDPTYLSRGSGKPTVNLDGWMMGKAAVLDSFREAAASADVALIEGVMGLFDGASPTSDEGSSAEIAKWLEAPVLLVVDASGMARSLAAVVHGFASYDTKLRVSGVICNRVGSRGHLELLRQAQPARPILGGLDKHAELAFPQRHLGLFTADRGAVPESVIDAWAGAIEAEVDVAALLQLAREAPPLPAATAAATMSTATVVSIGAPRCRIGVARDAAFHFYYADNLRRLERLGAELVDFSPIGDAELPAVNALYFGGGYPEAHAEALANNQSLLAAIRGFARGGGPVYGECGGYMYLVDAIRTRDGRTHPMLGLLRGTAVMRERRVALGYVDVESRQPSLIGPAGTRFRGHQFRHSELQGGPAPARCVYALRRRRGADASGDGEAAGNVLGSYVHAHWASNPQLAEALVAAARHTARHGR